MALSSKFENRLIKTEKEKSFFSGNKIVYSKEILCWIHSDFLLCKIPSTIELVQQMISVSLRGICSPSIFCAVVKSFCSKIALKVCKVLSIFG